MKKRALDLFLSLFFFIVSLPVLSATAIWILLADGSPIFFVQTRVGKDGVPFSIVKFRTLRTDAPENLPAYSAKNLSDYRIFGGKFLRRTGLDELPQLWCVIAGKMSLVGPRPLIFEDAETLKLRHKNGADRLLPGITGYAQIHGRSALSPHEKAKLDGYYAKHRSLSMDLFILLKTIPYILFQNSFKTDGAESQTPLE